MENEIKALREELKKILHENEELKKENEFLKRVVIKYSDMIDNSISEMRAARLEGL